MSVDCWTIRSPWASPQRSSSPLREGTRDPEAPVCLGGAEQGEHVLVGIGDRVPAVTEPGGVAGDAPWTLDHARGAGGNRVTKFAVSVVAVDTHTQLVAFRDVFIARGPDPESGDAECRGCSL